MERETEPKPNKPGGEGGGKRGSTRSKLTIHEDCVTAARRVLATLGGEIVDMNGPPIACGTSYHPIAICGNTLGGLNVDRNFPV
jgi:hypothetical protein